MEENWKSSRIAKGYEISDKGRLKNKTGHIMALYKTGGYFITINGKKYLKDKLLLVADAFVPNPNNYDKVRIKIGRHWQNKLYNNTFRIENIEWYPSKNWKLMNNC